MNTNKQNAHDDVVYLEDLPGVPHDFGRVLALLDGREPVGDNRIRLAPGTKIADILPVTTRLLAEKKAEEDTEQTLQKRDFLQLAWSVAMLFERLLDVDAALARNPDLSNELDSLYQLLGELSKDATTGK